MKQLRKRNNYTLSIEAQEIIDRIPKQYKSKYMSDALLLKEKTDNEDFEKVTTCIKGVRTGNLVQLLNGDYEFKVKKEKTFDGEITLATIEELVSIGKSVQVFHEGTPDEVRFYPKKDV